MSDKLVKEEVITMPLSQCIATYSQYNQKAGYKAFQNINKSQYCANSLEGGSDSCHEGGSGGPLQIFRNSYTAHIVGIASFGIDSCDIKLPIIYTRVSHYVDWIQSHIWKE